MKAPFLLTLLVSATIWSHAQTTRDPQKVLQQLENDLRQAASDSAKAYAGFALSGYWIAKGDTIKARQYLQQGMPHIQHNAFLEGMYRLCAAQVMPVGALEERQAGYLKADSLLARYTHADATRFRAQAWYQYGRVAQRKDDLKTFTDVLLHKAIPLAKQSGDNTLVGKANLAVAIVFKNTAQYDKAEPYIQQAIAAFKNKDVETHELITAYHTIAENYSLSGKNDRARLALDSAATLLPAYPDSEYYLDHYAAEGMYFTVAGQFKNALTSLEKGVAMAKRQQLRYEEQRLVMQQFYAYYNDKNFTKAKTTLEYLTQQPEMMAFASNRLQIYYGFAATYEGLQQMGPAYQWMKKYSELSDSVTQSQLKKDVQAMEVKYQNAEKQKEINALKAKTIQDALAAKNNRLLNGLLAGGIVFLLVVLVFALIVYRNRKKLHEQQLNDIRRQQQIQFSQAIMQGEEQERKRMAQELHDGLGGILAVARINLSSQVKDSCTDHQRTELEKITRQLDHSVHELRRIAHNMMPVALLKFGLQTALKDLCESLMNEHTSIDFQALNIRNTLRQDAQIHIYRIIQELLTNAIRHAHASRIMLQCSQDGNSFFITQEDNGRGFDTDTVAKAKGIGFSNIKNRVGYLHGRMDIDSSENAGTAINIELHVEN
ncbi:hypothetical protein EGT74_17455 [Chitinophaga lutea]|uniref:histidine kinase n=1 Tax=Chitinophaga lutea TaxID=2488634 RepID=A0A3N4PKT2_9BACT|nr:ATP-binding protein [Chitinophaga lutea]RPE08816.1 hypothetical protein EGT74_17455 [Chitinophaga lutea]